MKLSIEELELLARRSRLILTEREQEKFCRDLDALEELSSALLAYTNGITDEKTPQRLAEMRDDRVDKGLDREVWLSAAPARNDGYVPVPCVVVEEAKHE